MKIENKMMIFRVDLKNPYNLTAILLDLRHFLIHVCNFVFPRTPDFNISSFWFFAVFMSVPVCVLSSASPVVCMIFILSPQCVSHVCFPSVPVTSPHILIEFQCVLPPVLFRSLILCALCSVLHPLSLYL